MGAPMAGHLLEAGHDVRRPHAHAGAGRGRARRRARVGRRSGRRWPPARTPCSRCSAIPADVRDTVLGDGGVLAAMEPGSVLVDHTTSEPSLAAEIAEAAAERGRRRARRARVRRRRRRPQREAGDHGGRRAGGLRARRAAARGLRRNVVLRAARARGSTRRWSTRSRSPPGWSRCARRCSTHTAAGLDAEAVLDMIGGGAAGSFSLATYGPRLLARRPRARVQDRPLHQGPRHRPGRGAAHGPGAPRPGARRAALRRARAQDLGQKGTQALLVALASMSGVELPAASG